MNKKVFLTEAAYLLGIIALAFGTALVEKSDFGVSVVVAPAYLLHLKISQYLPWFSFGIAEYCFQAFLILVTSLIMRKFRIVYLFSFVTAVLYGTTLDIMMSLVAHFRAEGMVCRIILFVVGMLICSLGVAFFFHTYIAPEAYELLVKEVSRGFSLNINKFKTFYDCTSCVVAVIMSFAFFGFGHFEGIKIGSLIGALLNGFVISRFSKILEHFFVFEDGLKLRRFFTTANEQ